MDSSEAQRSFAVGTIAECLPGLKHMTAAFVTQLLPAFLQTGTQDPCSEVRSNCFFGIGELALYGKEAVYPYPFLLFNNGQISFHLSRSIIFSNLAVVCYSIISRYVKY